MRACCLYTFRKSAWSKEGVCRLFSHFNYKAGSWDCKRRVIVKAEITNGQLNPRFIVTNLACHPKRVYDLYCKRGDIENRIKEFKLDLFAGRTSCHNFKANQFRLMLHVAASVLMSAIQQAVAGTDLAKAQAGTIRLRLLKIGARVVETTRRIWLHMNSSFTLQDTWAAVHRALGP